MSARFVAAKIMTPLFVPKPSISVNNWFNVFSRSSLEPKLAFLPRARPIASISSMKMMAGDFSFACLNKSRTREAPTPTNISTKSEPLSEKNGTWASPATALAKSVFPVPGGPTRRAPFGIFAPRLVYFSESLRNATISSNSSFAPSSPATSPKFTSVPLPFSKSCAFDFPMLKI